LRRRVVAPERVEGGVIGAAAMAMGQSAESLAESQAQGKSRARRALSTEGVRSIDIHAHYYPQTYLEAIAEDGKRFDCEYHMTDQGFYTKTPAGNQGPLPTKFIDLKQRIAEMDATGVAVQAISLTTADELLGRCGDFPQARQDVERRRERRASRLSHAARCLPNPADALPDHVVDELIAHRASAGLGRQRAAWIGEMRGARAVVPRLGELEEISASPQ